MSRHFRIPHRSDLVVVYYGIDAHHHRRSHQDPLRPMYRPIREPGVLTNRKKAESEGKIACPDCWAGTDDEK